jgi:hypothetical protein
VEEEGVTDDDVDRVITEAAVAAYQALSERLEIEWIPAAIVALERLIDRELAAYSQMLRSGRTN